MDRRATHDPADDIAPALRRHAETVLVTSARDVDRWWPAAWLALPPTVAVAIWV